MLACKLFGKDWQHSWEVFPECFTISFLKLSSIKITIIIDFIHSLLYLYFYDIIKPEVNGTCLLPECVTVILKAFRMRRIGAFLILSFSRRLPVRQIQVLIIIDFAAR